MSLQQAGASFDRDVVRKLLNAACITFQAGSIHRRYEKNAPKIFCPIALAQFEELVTSKNKDAFDQAHHKFVLAVLKKLRSSDKDRSLFYGEAAKPVNVFLKIVCQAPNAPLWSHLHAPLDRISMDYHAKEYQKEFEETVWPQYREEYPEKFTRSMIKPLEIVSIRNKNIYMAWQEMFRRLYGAAILADDIWTKKISGIEF